MATTEAALMSRGVNQLYISIGDPNKDGSVPVRLYFKPYVLMIWLGAGIMFLAVRCRFRSAPACRRAAAGQGQSPRRAAACGVTTVRYLYALLLLLASLVVSGARRAADEMLSGPEARDPRPRISEQLRCMVCQNESIDESEAPLAHDLRVVVRQRIEAGDSDAQVMNYIRRALRRIRTGSNRDWSAPPLCCGDAARSPADRDSHAADRRPAPQRRGGRHRDANLTRRGNARGGTAAPEAP